MPTSSRITCDHSNRPVQDRLDSLKHLASRELTSRDQNRPHGGPKKLATLKKPSALHLTRLERDCGRAVPGARALMSRYEPRSLKILLYAELGSKHRQVFVGVCVHVLYIQLKIHSQQSFYKNAAKRMPRMCIVHLHCMGHAHLLRALGVFPWALITLVKVSPSVS